MAWRITNVAQTQIPTGDVLPGFNLQQDGYSPTVTFVFENAAKAHSSREAMLNILDNCAAIVHVGTR